MNVLTETVCAVLFAGMAVNLSAKSAVATLPVATAGQPAGLKDSYRSYFPIGAAVTPAMLADRRCDSMLRLHFNSLTAENVMKPESLQPCEGAFDFSNADRIADYARRNGMRLRGHTLVWYNQTPQWWFIENGDTVGKERLYDRLEEYISTVMRHFKGQVYCWDVVNEAMSDDSKENYRRSLWYAICGPDYIEKAFRLAHAADPDALLFYNDYNLSLPGKRENVYNMLKGLIDRGVPIHGVGMQAHLSICNYKEAEFEKAIVIFSSLGLKVQITELDVSVYSYGDPQLPQIEYTPDIARRQAEVYDSVFRLLRKHRDVVTGATFWGVSDDRTWLNDYPVKGRRNYPLLFDRNQMPKDAYFKVMDFN